MAKQKWVMIKPGTVIHGVGWKRKDKTHVFTESDTKLRYSVEYDCTFKKLPNGDLKYDWILLFQGDWWLFENSNAAFTEVKIPALKKEFRTLAVRGSEWEFEKDWTFNGWVDNGTVEHTIPAGTRVKIIDDKMRLAWYSPQEKCIVSEISPGLEPFAEREYFTKNIMKDAKVYIPAREASGYLKLVKAGKTKTYWKMEDSKGNAFVDKRFANLGNLKSSLRVRFNLVKYDPNEPDEYIPEWIIYDESDPPDVSKGVFAIQYDHATDKEIKREDMKPFLSMAILSSP